MSNRPPINWTRALSDMRADRAVRREIREEALRVPSRVFGVDINRMVAWRGNDGRRSIFTVHPLDARELADRHPFLALAVSRPDRIGTPVAAATRADIAAFPGGPVAWLAAARRDGATELHLHLISADETVCASIRETLAPPAPARAA